MAKPLYCGYSKATELATCACRHCGWPMCRACGFTRSGVKLCNTCYEIAEAAERKPPAHSCDPENPFTAADCRECERL